MKKKMKELSAPATTAPPQKQDELKMIPRTEIVPDPDQPRKIFSEDALKELAENIRVNGIVQPLIVRFVPAKYRIQEPDLHRGEWLVLERTPQSDIPWTEVFKAPNEGLCVNWAGMENLKDRYMIVAGERRWRASELAGVATLPCLVRDVDAHKKFAIQFIENNQRENLTALEEAEALESQLTERRKEKPEFSVEDLAKEIGMSRAALYGRLVLTRLHKPVREALLAGKITASAAGVVAIVPLPNQQEKLLKEITDEDAWNYPFSVRDVQELVEDEYCKQLSQAPFDPKLTYGNSADLLNACTNCLERSGNMTEQFPELAKRPNVCTNPECFAKKVKAHWLQKAENAKVAGKTVLTEAEFRKVKGQYAPADKPGYLFEKHYYKAAKDVLGKHAPEPVLVATKQGLAEFYKLEELAESAKAARVKLSRDRSETPEQKKEGEAKAEEAKKLRAKRESLLVDLAPAFAQGLAKLKPVAVWKLLKPRSELGKWNELGHAIQKATKNDQAYVAAFLLEDDLRSAIDYNSGRWEKDALALFRELGVDVEAEEKTRAPALPLNANGKPEQGKLLEVKASRKGKRRKGK